MRVFGKNENKYENAYLKNTGNILAFVRKYGKILFREKHEQF